MKNLLFTIILLASTYHISFAQDLKMRTQEFPDKEMKSQKKEIVKLVSQEISDTLPQTIDKYTTLVSVSSVNTTLLYTFEINTGSKSDESIKNEDRSRMKKAVTKGVCQSSRKFLEAGISTSYIYINAISKAHLFQFDIKQKDCTSTTL